MRADRCFHCALPIPAGCDFSIDLAGATKPVCCPGCKAVAELIFASGMQNYYDLRDNPEPGVGRPEGETDEWQIFNRDDMQQAFAAHEGDTRVATIYAGGMYCSACSWLIESTLNKTNGVQRAETNPVTHRVQVSFAPNTIGLGDILGTLAALGYKPQPLAPESAARPELEEQRAALKRLLVASLGMMQVMMFAVALYAGDFQGIEANMQYFLRMVSFVVTTPVVFYAARPFFASAIRGLRARQPGMDLPVSIAVGSAYVASTYATMTNGPAVWFDSVTMFVFFLTVGRYLEMRARHRSVDRTMALSALLPNTVNRVVGDSAVVVPVSQLSVGDRIIVRAGDAVPADGVIASGLTSVSESILTGESAPRLKTAGDSVYAGSTNIDGMIEIVVKTTGVDTTIGAISRLSERARYARPAFVQLADRIASHIVIALLIIAIAVAACWYFLDPSRAFVITLSVLVVTCPCALALATPAAFAAAGSRLADLRILLTNGNAIEVLARSNHIVFDKTGTLTSGRPEIDSTETLDSQFTEERCRQIAAALEAESLHPIAHAFAHRDSRLRATNIRNVVGKGVVGTVDKTRWRLGNPEFVDADPASTETEQDRTCIYLANESKVIARFCLKDELRPDVYKSVRELRDIGFKITLLSGDAEKPVRRIANSLAIDDYHFGCSPEYKLAVIREQQSSGDVVTMVGDGINDTPVLAGADASIAPAHAAQLAQTSADVIMLGESLLPVVTAIRMSRQTMRIVRQNLVWAIVYNALALPLAAVGLVPPWMAAVGMSASSLIVVLNALRLSRFS